MGSNDQFEWIAGSDCSFSWDLAPSQKCFFAVVYPLFLLFFNQQNAVPKTVENFVSFVKKTKITDCVCDCWDFLKLIYTNNSNLVCLFCWILFFHSKPKINHHTTNSVHFVLEKKELVKRENHFITRVLPSIVSVSVGEFHKEHRTRSQKRH